MKTLIILILLGGLTFGLVSCTDGLKNENKIALYVLNTDSTVVIYKNDAKTTPLIFKKPVIITELKKFSIPYNVVTEKGKSLQMTRYVYGKLNDFYDISIITVFNVALLYTLLIILFLKRINIL